MHHARDCDVVLPKNVTNTLLSRKSGQWKPHRCVQTILLSYVVLYDNTGGVTRKGTEGLEVTATCKTGDLRNCAPHTCGRDARAPGTHVAQSLEPGEPPAPPARTWLNHFAFRYRGGRSPFTFNVQPSTFHLQRATFNALPSTCNLQLSTAISGRNASDQRHP